MNTVQKYNWLPVRQDQEGNYKEIDADKNNGLFENNNEVIVITNTKVNEVIKHFRHISRVIWRIENNVYREDK